MEPPESAYSNADGGADEQLEEGGDLTLGVVVADGGGVHGADGGGEADSDAQEASHDGHVPVILPADHEDGEDGGDETEDDERHLDSLLLGDPDGEGGGEHGEEEDDGVEEADVDGELVGREVAVVVDGALDQGLGEARDDTSVVAENATTKDVNESYGLCLPRASYWQIKFPSS